MDSIAEYEEFRTLDKDGHFDLSGVMKEAVYGWYPPANNPWKTYRAEPTYRKECMYKHSYSKFTDQDGVGSPQPPAFMVTGRSAAPQRSASPSRARSRQGSARSQTAKSVQNLEINGTSSFSATDLFRPGSSTSLSRSPSKPPTPHKTRPWAMRMPTPDHSLIPQPPTTVRDGAGSRTSSRAQSATIPRSRVVTKPRTIKSAGPSRSCTSQPDEEGEKTVDQAPEDPAEEDKAPEELTEPTDDQEGEENVGGEAEREDIVRTPSPVDYDEQLEKYGWRMQVPGDPLNLKTPCLRKRYPYTVKCEVPEQRPPPPQVHMENYETYFYNTIPQRPMSFVIHKEWVSEILHAKRMELQKRDGGINYRYKNFSFVY